MDIDLLKSIGFSDKSANLYLVLLSLGPSSVRKLAEKTGLNRGTVYDTLKWLQEQGVVDYYDKDSKQCFVAEEPDKLRQLVASRRSEIQEVEKKLGKLVPELQAIYNRGGERPVAKYYEKKELKKILEDVLNTCEQSGENLYRIYSAVDIREYLYEDFPTFSDARVGKNISVKVIALGEGGEVRGLDERKWLKTGAKTICTYIIIYPGKTAYISLDAKGEPLGVVIENEGIFQTQKMIFDSLWGNL